MNEEYRCIEHRCIQCGGAIDPSQTTDSIDWGGQRNNSYWFCVRCGNCPLGSDPEFLHLYHMSYMSAEW